MIMSMQGRVMTDDRGISMRMHVSRGATAHIVLRHINIVHIYIYTWSEEQYSGTCLRWSLCKAATSLKQPASLVPDNTKALESTSVEQPPLYNGQLELAHRRLS